MPVISVRDLTKVYALGEVQVRALRGVYIEIEAGEFVSVTGPSGSCKSTILSCLDHPASGQYFLDGADMSKLSRNELAVVRNRKIGFVFQGFNLLARTSALENAELQLLYNGGSLKGSLRCRRALSGSRTERITTRISSQVDSSSAWPSRARSPMNRRSCSPTSRPGTSTRGPAQKSWTSSSA